MSPSPTEAAPHFLDLKGASQRCSLSTRTLRRRILVGDLPAYKAGGKLLIRLQDLDAWITQTPVPPEVDVNDIVSRVKLSLAGGMGK